MQSKLDDKDFAFLNQLFARLYEDDNYEKAFTLFLETLKEIVKFQKGDIYFYKDDHEHITFEDFIFVDWGEEHLSKYINDYVDIDDALPVVSIKQPVMFRSTDVFIQDERMKTKYYNELLLPAGMQYSIEGNIYMNNDGYVAGIGIHRPDEYGDFTQRDLEILKLARPHLVNISKKFMENRQDIDVYASTISVLYDINDIGLCIFDESLHVVDSNFNKTAFIQHEHVGEMIRSLITLCKSVREKDSRPCKERKGRSRITIGNVSYYAEVVYKEASQGKGKFVAMVYQCGDLIDKFIGEVCDRYALTERENEILKYVIKGMSTADIAKKLFISMPTVKKHLTSIYSKMDIDGKHQILNVLME